MKKIISIFISLTMTLVIASTCSFAALAETTTKYWAPRPNCQDLLSYVNGELNYDDIASNYDREKGEITFIYTGKGDTNTWEFPLSQEGKDYEIISQKDNSITIKLINENQELPYINALVDFGETTTKTKKVKSTEQTDNQSKQDTENETSTTEKKASETTTYITSTTTAENESISVSETTANTNEESDDKNTNKIIVPCVIAGAAVVVIAGIVLKKKSKK